MVKLVRKRKLKGNKAPLADASRPASLGVRTRSKTRALRRLPKAAVLEASAATYLELRSRRLVRRLALPAARARRTATRGRRTARSPSPPKPGSNARPSAASSPEVESGPCKAEEGGASPGLGGSMPLKICSSKKEEEARREPSPEVVGAVAVLDVCSGDNASELEAGRNARESTPSNLIRDPENIPTTPGSSTRPTKTIPCVGGMGAAKVLPSAQDIEELFVKPEQLQQKVFTDKYNFDPVNEQPLPGRYEWVKLNP